MYFKTCCWELRTHSPIATVPQIYGALSFPAGEKNSANPENGTTGESTALWDLITMYAVFPPMENGYCITHWHTSPSSLQFTISFFPPVTPTPTKKVPSLLEVEAKQPDPMSRS